MHLGIRNKRIEYHMHKEGVQVNLQTTELETDLGVHVDTKLTLTLNCEKKVNMANKLLGLVRRSCVYLDNVTVKTLYASLIRPYLEYENTAWCSILKKTVNCCRTTKLAPALRDLSYVERITVLDLPSLYYRRARGDTIETYKHICLEYMQ